MSNSSSSTKLSLSSLDFDGIKNNLIAYLQSQTEFSDYQFAGSGLNVILNILAYNSTYLAYYLNFVANESFLDSADRRENIVSIAKQLGYTPTSRKSAQAIINIKIIPPNNSNPTITLVIPKYTTFNTNVSGINYTFVTTQTYSVDYDSVNNCYSANNISIFEGIPYTFQYTVSTSNPIKYVIPSPNIDTSQLTVQIQDSALSTSLTTFNLINDLNVLNGTSNVFFLQEGDNMQYEVYFGDGILGKSLIDGNIVNLNYIICNADLPNYANTFAVSGNIGGYSNIIVTTINPASGGAERETNDSIRFNAPQNYQTQNRAVTASDYETIITREYPNVDSVAIWGGETNNPPKYGTVFISLKPVSGYVITNLTKQNIVTNILQSRNIVSIVPVIVDPDYTYLVINSIVKYNDQSTILSSGQLQNNVLNTIQNFSITNIGHFGDIFRYSQLANVIDNTDPSISNNLTTVLLQKRIIPDFNNIVNYTLQFSNSLIPGTLTSDSFVDSQDQNYSLGELYYFDDDENGNIRIYKYKGSVKSYTNIKAGIISYDTGTIVLNSFKPSVVTNASQNLGITVQPLINDVTPIQNQIIVIDPLNITINMKVNSPPSVTSGKKASLISIFNDTRFGGYNYYIDPMTGNDSNSGTSVTTAWATTAQADTISLANSQSIGYKYNGFWYLYRVPGMTADLGQLTADIVSAPADSF
jgi:hypothetical protein